MKTLAEACAMRPPKSEAREKLSDCDLVSFLPMEDLGIDRKHATPTQTKSLGEVVGSYTYFAEGDVLLAKITPCFENGKIGIASRLKNQIGFGSSEYFVFRPDSLLLRDWLYYYLSRPAFREEGAARMTGAVGHKRVAKEFIEAYPIPLPPLVEQHRIVGILDEAFAGLAIAKANAEKNLQSARALFESYLQAIFTERDDQWIEKSLEEAVEDDCSLSYGIVQPGGDVDGGLPVVRPTDLTQEIIRLDGLKRIDRQRAESYQRTKLKGGDFLLCVRGTTGIVSRAAQELAGANVTRGIVPIRFRPSLIFADFGFHLLRTDLVQAQISSKTYGAALMQINIGDLRKVRLHFPLQEAQQRIAASLDALRTDTQRLEALYQGKLAALEELKKSILHQAFTGQL